MALTIAAPTKARSFGFSRASAYLPKAYVVATQLDSFSKKEIDAMWRKFKKHGDDGQIRNQLIEFYLPVVRVTAERMSNKLPSHIEVDELIQAGVFGLMDAIDGFDPTRGVKFEIYAKQRIHGAILDDLRSQDFAPRLVRTHSHKLDRAYKAVEAETGAVPEPCEVAAKLEITLEDYDRWMREINMANIISLDRVNSTNPEGGEDMRAGDIIEDKNIAEPMNALEKKNSSNSQLVA
ncbi:MAG: sigma-70 family RNA polymerase sigma factor [Planctomycetota bacterium]